MWKRAQEKMQKIQGARIMPEKIKRNRKLIAAAAAFVLIAAVVITLLVRAGIARQEQAAADEAVKQGVNYLKKLENGSVEKVNDLLAEEKRKEMEAQREQRRQQLINGQVDVWSLFGDAVIMGDSRAVGFSFFEYLPESRVLAGSGDTILSIEEHEDELVSLNPSVVFLCYGLNDTGMGIWESAQSYAADYLTILRRLKSELPNTLFFVSSILPVTWEALEQTPAWGDAYAFSEAVKEVCAKNGFGYVDCQALIDMHQDMYDEDGIHMVKEFYPLWASQMMLTVYENDAPAEESETAGEAAEETQEGE